MFGGGGDENAVQSRETDECCTPSIKNNFFKCLSVYFLTMQKSDKSWNLESSLKKRIGDVCFVT